MAIRTIKLSGPSTLTNIATVLYTVPTGKHMRLHSVFAVNSGTVAARLSLAYGDVTVASNRFIDRESIVAAAGSVPNRLTVFPDLVFEAGDTIEGLSSNAVGSTIAVMLSGTLYDT